MENRIGSVIRINRLVQNISLRELAIIIGIEYSQLSKIERGIESTNDFIMDSIFSSLDLDYENVKEFLKEDERYFNQLYKDLLYRRDKNSVRKILDEYNDLVKNSCVTIENIIINLMYCLLWGESLSKAKDLLILMKHMDKALSLTYRQYYYQYLSYYYFILGKINYAIKAINEIDFYSVDHHTYGLILYTKGLILAKNGQCLDSYELLVQAKRIFEDFTNYIRSAFCNVSIANVFLLSEKYDKAMELYLESIEVYERLNLSVKEKVLICDNILLICIITNKFDLFFEKVLSFDDEVLLLLEQRPRYYYYQIVALFNVGKIQECLECIKKFKEINTIPVDGYMASYYEYKIKGFPNEKLVRTLERTFQKLDKFNDHGYTKLVLNLLLKEYEEIGDYEKLYHYALKLTELHP